VFDRDDVRGIVQLSEENFQRLMGLVEKVILRSFFLMLGIGIADMMWWIV
jgi:hypothetical protein